MNNSPKEKRQYILIAQGKSFSFKAYGRVYKGAKLKSIQSDTAIIETEAGHVEAVELESMSLLHDELNAPNTHIKTAPASPLTEQHFIAFPSSDFGSTAFTNRESLPDTSELGSGGRVRILPSAVFYIVRPSDVVISSDAQGNPTVTIYDANNYAG